MCTFQPGDLLVLKDYDSVIKIAINLFGSKNINSEYRSAITSMKNKIFTFIESKRVYGKGNLVAECCYFEEEYNRCDNSDGTKRYYVLTPEMFTLYHPYYDDTVQNIFGGMSYVN